MQEDTKLIPEQENLFSYSMVLTNTRTNIKQNQGFKKGGRSIFLDLTSLNSNKIRYPLFFVAIYSYFIVFKVYGNMNPFPYRNFVKDQSCSENVQKQFQFDNLKTFKRTLTDRNGKLFLHFCIDKMDEVNKIKILIKLLSVKNSQSYFSNANTQFIDSLID